jgi:hypothetical protein
MSAVGAFCNKACRLKSGRLVDWGDVPTVVARHIADVTSGEAVHLAHRKDRVGEGGVIITGFGLEDPQGGERAAGVSGGDLALRIEYQASADTTLEMMTFGVAVNTLQGLHLFECSTDLSSADLGKLPRAGSVRCVLSNVPLCPGTYSINLIVRRKGIIEDWVTEAAMISIEPGDFFSVNRLPVPSEGSILVKSHWTRG